MLLYIYICTFKKICKEINYFVFILHQVNNHGVSRRGFTETDVRHLKKNSFTGVFQRFFS